MATCCTNLEQKKKCERNVYGKEIIIWGDCEKKIKEKMEIIGNKKMKKFKVFKIKIDVFGCFVI